MDYDEAELKQQRVQEHSMLFWNNGSGHGVLHSQGPTPGGPLFLSQWL